MENYHWRILLVDDDEDDYFLVSEMLGRARREMFSLEWASSFSAGHEALQRDEFDAVLVDYDLGERTGVDLIRAAISFGYHAPMILLTGMGSYQVDLEAMQAGAADYLEKKELNPGYLERSIRYAIERKRNETERERLLEENRRQRELLQKLFDRIPVMITLYRPDLQRFQFNPAFERTLGWTAEDARQPGVDMMEKFYPDPAYRREVAAFMAALTEGWRDFRVTTRDGAVVESSWSNIRLSDDTQVGIGIDLRERKQAERALRENRAYLQLTTEAGEIGLWDWDVKNGLVTWDARCRALFGVPAEGEVSEESFSSVAHPEDREKIITRLRAYSRQRETFEIEFRIRRPDGTVRWLNLRGRSALGESGQPSRVSGIVLDMTNRKQTEQELAEALEQVLFERNRLLAVMEALPVGVAICDDLGGVLQTNHAYELLWGGRFPETRSVADYAAFKAWWMDTGRPVEPDEWASARAVRDGETVLGQNLKIERFDGTRAYVLNGAAPVYDSQGKIVGSAVAILDITDLKRREQDAEFLAELGNRLLSIQEPEEVFRVVGAAVGQYLQAYSCYLSEEDQQTFEPVIREGYRRGAAPLNAPFPLDIFPPPVVNALQEGRKVVVDDTARHPFTRSNYKATFAPANLEAFFLLPRLVQGEWVGSLSVEMDRSYRWQINEIELLQTVANLAWLAVDNTRTQQSRKTAEERFRVALQNSPIVVFTQDLDLCYSWIHNPRPIFSVARILGKTDAELLEPEAAAVLTEPKRIVLQTGQSLRRELRYRIGDEIVVYDLWVEPLRTRTGEIIGLTGAAMDITELRRLEAAQVEQAARVEVQQRLIQQREQERLDLARDLHDGPLQEITAIIFGLAEAMEMAEKGPRLEKLAWVKDTLRSLAQEIRSFCNELRPPALAPFGLEKAIRSHVHEFGNRYRAIRIHLDLFQDGQTLPEDTRMALFRIYQEVLNNIARHSRARDVWITLGINDRTAVLEIWDNGAGFQVPQDWVEQARSGHFGLIGMFERAEAIHAAVELDSGPGQGTRVRVTVDRAASGQPGVESFSAAPA